MTALAASPDRARVDPLRVTRQARRVGCGTVLVPGLSEPATLTMTSRRLSSAHPVRDGHPRGVHGIELGHEPPIGETGEQADNDRAGPNMRWLCASVLVGLTGASLIGAAISTLR